MSDYQVGQMHPSLNLLAFIANCKCGVAIWYPISELSPEDIVPECQKAADQLRTKACCHE